MSTIEIKNFNKSYNHKIVIENLNLTVKEGSFFTLLGPSGCGKTTLLKSIAGIIDDYSGEIIIDGSNINSTSIENRNITFVFQDHLLFPNMTVFNNIAFGLSIKKLPKEELHTKVSKLLNLLELKGLENKYPNELSGGQKQRVSIGRALAVEPNILLMDEPFSSLDMNLRTTMHELIKTLHKTLNLTIIFVTHDKNEALMLSDEVALLHNGTLLQVGSPYEIYEHPKSLEVANFFGNTNLIKGKVINKHFICNNFNISLELKNSYEEMFSYYLVLKPEDLLLTPNINSHIYIKDKNYMGEKFLYTIASKDGTTLNVSSSKHLDIPLNTSVSITLINNANEILFKM